MEDFSKAQVDFVPYVLKDVPLQKSDVEWTDIGGVSSTYLVWLTQLLTCFRSQGSETYSSGDDGVANQICTIVQAVPLTLAFWVGFCVGDLGCYLSVTGYLCMAILVAAKRCWHPQFLRSVVSILSA